MRQRHPRSLPIRRLPSTYLRLMYDDSTATMQLNLALSACMRCHSGGWIGTVLCENGECGTLFARLGAVRRLAAADERLERLPDCEAAGLRH